MLPVESESERGEGGDERTELLLAATFLLMVILRSPEMPHASDDNHNTDIDIDDEMTTR